MHNEISISAYLHNEIYSELKFPYLHNEMHLSALNAYI